MTRKSQHSDFDGVGFLRGAGYVFRGIKLFYANRRWWKYTLPPLLLMALIYAAVFYLVYVIALPAAHRTLFNPVDYPQYLTWLATLLRWLFDLAATAMALVTLAATLSSLYELFGALLFDYLVERCEHDLWSVEAPPFRLIKNLHFAWSSGIYGLVSGILTIALLAVGCFLPVAGPALAVAWLGYRLAVSYLFPSAFLRNRDVTYAKRSAAARRTTAIGFGVTAYLLLMLPFAALFLLPGLTVAGVLFYHGENC